jgi:hypothetical protein
VNTGTIVGQYGAEYDAINPMTKSGLIDWLVRWRQERKGSISPANHRKLLQTRTKKELERMYQQITSQDTHPHPRRGR